MNTSTQQPIKLKKVYLFIQRFEKWKCAGSLWCWSFKSTHELIQSTTLVIAYLIKYKGMSFAAALKLCKTKRPQVCPNLGFQLQLKAYDKKLHQETTQSLEIKSQTNKPFPILKQRQLEKNITNFHRSYYELKEVKGKQSNLTLSKQPRPQKNEPKEL